MTLIILWFVLHITRKKNEFTKDSHNNSQINFLIMICFRLIICHKRSMNLYEMYLYLIASDVWPSVRPRGRAVCWEVGSVHSDSLHVCLHLHSHPLYRHCLLPQPPRHERGLFTGCVSKGEHSESRLRPFHVVHTHCVKVMLNLRLKQKV